MLTIKDIENFKETFNDETDFGEPQHWIYLKSGRSLEVTHEEYGLSENEQYFSIRLHCSEDDFDNMDYYKTCGIITTYYKTCGVITTLTATTAKDTLNCINAIMRTFKEMED